MQSKKINELGTNVSPSVNDLTVVGDAATGQLKKITLNQIASLFGSVGGVSSVAMTVPTGLTVTGSPITTSGTLAVTLTAGYSIPTTAKQSEWDTGYAERLKWDGGASGLSAPTARTSLGLVIGTDVLAYRTFGTAANNDTGDFATAAQGTNADTAYTNRITGASLPLNISSNVISIAEASTTVSGFLSSTDWNTFNNKVSTASLSNYLLLTGGTLTGTLNGTIATFSGQVNSSNSFYCAVTSNTIGDRSFGGNSYSFRNNTNDDFNIDIYNRTSSLWFNALKIANNGGASTFTASVGIGVSPSYKLDVRGTYVESGIITVRSTDSAAINKGGVLGFGGFHNGSANESQWAWIKGAKENSNGNDNASYLAFATMISGESPTEKLRISSTGAATFSSSVTAAQLVINAPATTNYGSLNAITNAYAYQEYKYNGTSYGYLGQYSAFLSGASSTDLMFVSVNNLIFGTSGSFAERMRITSDGNVLIGTTTDNGSKLQLSGSLTATTAVFNGYSINGNPTSSGTGSTFTRYLNTGGDFYIGLENSAGSFFGATAYANVMYMGSTNFEMFWSGTRKVTFTSGGSLLLNTNTDLGAGYKLQVNGSISMAYANFFNFKGSSGAGDVLVDNSGSSLRVTGSVDISSSTLIQGLLTNYNSYNTQTSSYTLVLADASKIVEMNVGSANTVTVPLNSSVAFPIGTEITVIQYGSGVTTIVAASGVTFRSKDFGTRIGDQYTGATLVKRGTNEWYLIGNIQP